MTAIQQTGRHMAAEPEPTTPANTWAKPLLLLALATFAAAVVLALMPISASGVDCGNAIHPNTVAGDVADVEAGVMGQPSQNLAGACEDKTGGRMTLVYALGGPALAAAFLGFLALPKTSRRNPAGQ